MSFCCHWGNGRNFARRTVELSRCRTCVTDRYVHAVARSLSILPAPIPPRPSPGARVEQGGRSGTLGHGASAPSPIGCEEHRVLRLESLEVLPIAQRARRSPLRLRGEQIQHVIDIAVAQSVAEAQGDVSGAVKQVAGREEAHQFSSFAAGRRAPNSSMGCRPVVPPPGRERPALSIHRGLSGDLGTAVSSSVSRNPPARPPTGCYGTVQSPRSCQPLALCAFAAYM